MSTDRDTTRIIRSWLRSDEHVSADRILDTALDIVDATPQRHAGWLARRTPFMNTVRIALAAAAVVAVALIGYQLVIAPNAGEPAPGETPVPTPTAIMGTTNLDPGTYSIGAYFPAQFNLTIVDGWETWGADENIVRIWKPCQPGVCTGYSSILSFEIVLNAYADPCHADFGDPTGDSVDDLVNALTNMSGSEAGPVTEVSVDGRPGRSFEFAFTGPTDPTCLDDGTSQWYSGDRVTWGFVPQRIVVLDVDGTRLVIDAVTYSGDRQEMDAIIDSIQFE